MIERQYGNMILEPTWVKTMPKTPQQATPTPQEQQKTCENLRFFTIFTMRPMCENAPKSTKNRPKIDPKSSKLSTKSPSQRQHGPTWAALAPTQRSLNPSWAYPGDDFRRKSDPHFAKDAPSRPKSAPRPSRPRFWTIFDPSRPPFSSILIPLQHTNHCAKTKLR